MKKKFLMSVMAASAVIAGGAATSIAKTQYEEITGKTFKPDNGLVSKLLMEAPTEHQATQISGHYSHSSHGSHGSHGSHSSHSSGY